MSPMSMVAAWTGATSEYRRYGRTSVPAGDFYAFAAGAVEPLGLGDAGTRNVGPRMAGERTATASGTTITATAHGLSNGDAVRLTRVKTALTWTGTAYGRVPSTLTTLGTTYYVVSATTNTFGLAASPGGAALSGGSASLAYVPAANALTYYAGDYTITTPGQVVEGLDIHGRLYVNSSATNAVVRDCIIRGPATSTTYDAIVTGASLNLRGLTIEWSRLDATNRSNAWTEAIRCGNYTMRYCETAECVDGLGSAAVGNGVTEMSRIGRGAFFAWENNSTGAARSGFPTHSDLMSHADGAQIQQASGWVIRGCSVGGTRAATTITQQVANRDPNVPAELAVIQTMFDAGEHRNAAIIITPAASGVGALIEDNWIEGGAAALNLSHKSIDYLGGVTVQNNVFRNSAGAYDIYIQTGVVATLTGNTLDGGGSPSVNYY